MTKSPLACITIIMFLWASCMPGETPQKVSVSLNGKGQLAINGQNIRQSDNESVIKRLFPKAQFQKRHHKFWVVHQHGLELCDSHPPDLTLILPGSSLPDIPEPFTPFSGEIRLGEYKLVVDSNPLTVTNMKAQLGSAPLKSTPFDSLELEVGGGVTVFRINEKDEISTIIIFVPKQVQGEKPERQGR